jgi:hypothetical protein
MALARLLQDGEDACVYLSSNLDLIHYGETDVERLRLYLNQLIHEPDENKRKAIRDAAGAGSSKVAQLIKSTGSFAVLKLLMNFGQHIVGPSGLSAAWLHDRLLGVSGGVRLANTRIQSLILIT